jgi:hypothetical protein
MTFRNEENWDILYIDSSSLYLEKEYIVRCFKNQGLDNVEDIDILNIETAYEGRNNNIFRIYYSIKTEKKEMI